MSDMAAEFAKALTGLPEFKGFGKIPRLSRKVVITEKIDGTNGLVHVNEYGVVLAGSKNRWLDPDVKGGDNFGFGRWVRENADELRDLGVGFHYGEWWGNGIERGYGLPRDDKRFSLFNVHRWGNSGKIGAPVRPRCCSVVPMLGVMTGFETGWIQFIMEHLKAHGSHAVPGFMNPEGIVCYHAQGNVLFKKTLENDEQPKDSKETQ